MKTSNKLLTLFCVIFVCAWGAVLLSGRSYSLPFRLFFDSEQMADVTVYKMPYNDYASFIGENGNVKYSIICCDRETSLDMFRIEGDTLTFNYKLEALPQTKERPIEMILTDTTFVQDWDKILK